jgi:CubicO group peptidase (beta-lactamase class C family)
MRDHTFGQVVDWGLGVMINSWQDGVLVPYQYGPHASRNAFGHGGYQSTIGFCDPDKELAVGLVYNGCCGEVAHNRRAAEALTILYEELGLG